MGNPSQQLGKKPLFLSNPSQHVCVYISAPLLHRHLLCCFLCIHLCCGLHSSLPGSRVLGQELRELLRRSMEDAVVMSPAAKKTPASRFRRVCVFCGSSPGNKPAYQVAAIQLGHQLVERGIDLVYGGGSVGLMGLISRAVHNGGGHVLGVVPKAVLPREVIGETPGELKAVSGMHQRKAEMARHSDAFIALPGGYGTLEELLEVITWAQLGIHNKPVGLLNVDGYYDSLLAFIDKAVDEGFVSPAARHIIVSAATAHDLLARLEDYVPVADASAVKLSWEMEQIGVIHQSDMAR